MQTPKAVKAVIGKHIQRLTNYSSFRSKNGAYFQGKVDGLKIADALVETLIVDNPTSEYEADVIGRWNCPPTYREIVKGEQLPIHIMDRTSGKFFTFIKWVEDRRIMVRRYGNDVIESPVWYVVAE